MEHLLKYTSLFQLSPWDWLLANTESESDFADLFARLLPCVMSLYHSYYVVLYLEIS